MDPDIILSKIDSLRRCVTRLEVKRPPNVEILKNDEDLQDILTINLEKSVQICVDIASHILAESDSSLPATMSETFLILSDTGIIDRELSERMQKAVGFRNIAVHEYDKIDWEIVYSILTRHLDDFKHFASAILSALKK